MSRKNSIRLTLEDREKLVELHCFLLDHLDMSYTVSFLANRAGLTRAQLNEGFQLLFGEEVIPFMAEMRLNAAIFLMWHLGLSSEEAAEFIGCRDPESFHRVFKKQFNCSTDMVKRSYNRKQ